MIDTIILRLHDLNKYKELIKGIGLNRNNGYTKSIGEVDTAEVVRLRNMGYGKPKDLISILQINKSGEFLVKTEFGKQVNSSNHYAFTYFIDWTNDLIEFNFSIPKYRYGSNVLMYLEHIGDRDFKYYENSTWEYNMRRAPSLLKSFIDHFLKNEYILYKIDKNDLEIHRIDVCFNQLFRSKEDALLYLDYQKKLKKKFAREEEGTMREYATSIMYTTKRYSAKIYHKGSEYKKNDLKEHLRINNEKGVKYFKTDEFQAFSDRMLRYELTIRNAELNSLYKNNLFRSTCPFFAINYKNYLRISNTLKRNDRISKKIGGLHPRDKEAFLDANPYEKISKDDRANYKHIRKILESRTHFMLSIDERAKKYNEESVNYDENTAFFSKKLVSLCLQKLLDFINEFQISELPDSEIIIAHIDQYNRQHRSQLPKADMLHFYSLLILHGSFKEVAKFSHYSRATLYRYKDRFKKIGITETTIKPIQYYSIPETKIDFKEYHSHLIYKCNLLRGIRIC
jgi:hypothetical protein